MPSPTAQAIEAIAERLKQACTNGTREPTAALTAAEHNAMLDLHIHNPMAAGILLQHIREHARTLEGWSRTDINQISFRVYERGAERHERDQANIESSANVVRMTAQRNARVRRARTHDVSGDVHGELSTAQMLETDSVVLVAKGLIQQHRAGRIWHDEFYKRAVTDWRGDEDGTVLAPRIVSDEEVIRIMCWLHVRDRRLNKIGMALTNTIVDAIANEDKRNAPRDWMAGLQWDGVARLGSLFSRGFGAPDSEFNREAGRCWFVSMAARCAQPGAKVDTMPVFIGPQGIRKSQALEVIGGDWYRAASSSIDSKDFLQELHGTLVMEVPELHSMLSSRLGSAKIKAVLSTRVDNFRLPYGMRVSEHKRTCVICGTTNNRDWHQDETGARRFWPVHCGVIDLDWLREWRGQLFAEAHHYYFHGLNPLTEGAVERGKWWNVPEAEQAELMGAETYVSPFHEMISGRLRAELARGSVYKGDGHDVPTPWDGTASESTVWGNMLTVTRIGVQWLGLSPDALGRGSAHGKTIGSVMRMIGWDTARPRVAGMSERPRCFVLVHHTDQNEPAQVESLNSGNSDGPYNNDGRNGPLFSDDEDSPF